MNTSQENEGYVFPIGLFFCKSTLKLPLNEDVWYQWLQVVSVCHHLLFISTVSRVGGGPMFQRREGRVRSHAFTVCGCAAGSASERKGVTSYC